MNKKAYKVMKEALIYELDRAYGYDVNINSIANNAAEFAASEGYHWDDYPRAWYEARNDTIWKDG